MTNIDMKSIGQLFDEMITTDFKIDAGQTSNFVMDRRHDLGNLIMGRTIHVALDKEKNRKMWELVDSLRAVLKECWNAQEIVFTTPIFNYSGALTEEQLWDNIYSVARAGKVAQETNAARNQWINAIDDLVGEGNISPLEKTYGVRGSI